MGTKMKLFDGDDNNEEEISNIEINKDFARRYEHNKKREDLQRLEEMKKKGVISSSSSSDESSSSEEEDSEEEQVDTEFFSALLKVRNQDPSLKQKDVKLFNSDDDKSDNGDGELKNEKKKTMYLKDVVAKHLIEDGPEGLEEEEEDDSGKRNKKKSYAEEQEDIRSEFLRAVEEAEEDGDGEFLKVKEKGGGEEEGDEEFREKLEEYFGRGDDELDENSKFLKEYFMNKLWVDKDGKRKKGAVDEEELDELLKDEEHIDKQEDYETNYRYEENAGDRVEGHARHVVDSVRNKKNARKEQRKSKEERMKNAEMERKEELKHLKNLKKQEMKEKLRRIREIAGIGEDENLPLDVDDLEEDFDPEEYDRVMKAAFDERYYNTEDNDPTFAGNDDEHEGDIEKPDFDKEDELLGLPKGWDVCKSDDGFSALRERILKDRKDKEGEDDSNGEEENEEEGEEEEAKQEGNSEEVSEEGKRKRKRKSSLLERAKEALMEEYYKLDYEDTIGDLKTRFKYSKVEPKRYGLKTEEVLMLDDKELNQYVSLKKIAPYREKEYKVPNSKRYQQKMKIRELLRGELLRGKKSNNQKKSKRKRSKDNEGTSTSVAGDVGDNKVEVKEANGDIENLSRKAKRKRRQAESKMSLTRRMAYGQIPSTSKSKKKH